MTSNSQAAILPAKADNISRGIILTLISVAIFGVQDAVAKILVQDYSSFQIVMMRFWGFAAFSLFLVARERPLRYALQSRVPGWQVLRGVLLVADIWLFALAIRTVPLAELQAISLIYPLLVTLFAIPVLGEKVGMFRLSAVAIGFAGALVIVRPGGLPLDLGLLFSVLSSTVYAVYVVVTRKVAKEDTISTNMAYVGVIGLLLTTAIGMFFWEGMDLQDLLLAFVLMVTTCAAHGLMMVALSIAPASVLQPFNYFSLPWAIALSFFVFGHLIDTVSLIGAAIIAAAGLVVMARERRKSPVAQPEAPLPGKE